MPRMFSPSRRRRVRLRPSQLLTNVPQYLPNSVKMVVTLANANELLSPVIVLTESEVCNAAFMKGRKSASSRTKQHAKFEYKAYFQLDQLQRTGDLENRQARYIVVMTLMECLRQEGEGHSRKGNISTKYAR